MSERDVAEGIALAEARFHDVVHEPVISGLGPNDIKYLLAMCSGSPEAQLPGGTYESTRDALEVAPQPFWDYWEGRRLVRVNLGLTETKQIAE